MNKKIPHSFISICFYILVPLIGYLDLVTGPEIGFSVFYLAPIMMAAWFHYNKKVSPILIPAMSAAAWLLADIYSGHRYSSQWIPYWNMSIRFIMFSIIGVSLSRLRSSQVKANMLSRTDALTGAMNSRYFNELATKEINRLMRYSEPISFAYFDLDNFKSINDTLGHHQGDQLLKELALLIRSNIREIDIFGRFGGDEFGILFPKTDALQIRAAMKKILSIFRNNVSEKWPVTLSVGVISYLVPPRSVDEMVRIADSLMYIAKGRGKDSYAYSYCVDNLASRKEEKMKNLLDRRAAFSLLLFPILLLAVTQTGYPGGSAEKARVLSPEYQERPVLESSLFRSDKDSLGEDAIQRILSSKLVVQDIVSIALFRIQENPQQAIRYYGYGYWRSEEYLKVQQSFISTIADEISKSDRVLEVVSLPSLLAPKEPTIAVIRETSVRLQADMVVVFTLTSNVYERYRMFQTNQAKAYCTCEGFLLDVRTGLIPFSRIVTREYLASKEKSDANFNETMARAEREAALLSLKSLGEQTVEFLSQLPRVVSSAQNLQLLDMDMLQDPLE